MSFESLYTELDWKGIYNNVVSNLVWIALLPIGGILLLFPRWVYRKLRISAFVRLCIANILGLIVLWVTAGEWSDTWSFVLAGGYSIAASFFVMRGFIYTGISEIYLSTTNGISFKQSLVMADGSIDFLGIGGDKLTVLPEFLPAMRRCATNGREVRFLLSPPDNALLEKLARRYGTSPQEYQRKVKDSLKRIAHAQRDFSLNIKVKFYPVKHEKDLQLFRLMFVNEKICLWSWTTWGTHVGAENPQVVLTEVSHFKRSKPAYKAFKDYYENLWIDAESKEVNLNEYI